MKHPIQCKCGAWAMMYCHKCGTYYDKAGNPLPPRAEVVFAEDTLPKHE